MASFVDFTSHPTATLLAMLSDADTPDVDYGPIRTQLACRGVKVRKVVDCDCRDCRSEPTW